MNKSFIQINDNYAAVSNEQGTIRVVSKKSAEPSFEKILKKENELEASEAKLKTSKQNLELNKIDIIGGEIHNLVTYGGLATIYFVSRGKLNPTGTVLLLATTYASLKTLACVMSGGTRIKKYKTRKELKENISRLEETVPELKEELKKDKENVQYEDNVTAVDEHAPYRKIVNAMDELKDDGRYGNSRVRRLLLQKNA